MNINLCCLRSAGKVISFFIAILVLAGTLPLPAQELKPHGPIPTDLEREAEARQVGTEAFIYGYPGRLNSFTRFRYNRDGSLDLYLQKGFPGPRQRGELAAGARGQFFCDVKTVLAQGGGPY